MKDAIMRQSMYSYLKSFCLLLLLFLVNCHSAAKVFDVPKFGQWFINPTTESFTTINTAGIDSSVSVTRLKADTGSFIDTLNDSSGTVYLMGFCTPSLIKRDTLYPLVIYLHGGTGTEVNTKGEKAYEMLRPLTDSMSIFLASPSANRDARWWSPLGLQRILQTVRYMTLHYPIDPEKIFLAGVSDGAAGCWAAANVVNGPFAGFFAISGFGGMLPSMGLELFPENIAQRPIYSINAGKDRIYPINIVNQFLEYMKSKNVNIISKEYPDQEHGFDYREKEYGNLCTYIRTWKRSFTGTINWIFTPGISNRPQSIIDWSINDVANVRYFSGVLNNDTLTVQSQGLASVTLNLPISTKTLYVRSNQKSCQKVNQIIDNNLYLQSLVTSCIPLNKNGHFFKIKL